jgi:hypothetical protein
VFLFWFNSIGRVGHSAFGNGVGEDALLLLCIVETESALDVEVLEGVDVDEVNPGAKTGPYGNGLRNNDLSIPLPRIYHWESDRPWYHPLFLHIIIFQKIYFYKGTFQN